MYIPKVEATFFGGYLPTEFPKYVCRYIVYTSYFFRLCNLLNVTFQKVKSLFFAVYVGIIISCLFGQLLCKSILVELRKQIADYYLYVKFSTYTKYHIQKSC